MLLFNKTAINLINQIRADNKLFLWLRRCFLFLFAYYDDCWWCWRVTTGALIVLQCYKVISFREGASDVMSVALPRRNPLPKEYSKASSPTYRHKLQFRSTAIWRCRKWVCFTMPHFFRVSGGYFSTHFASLARRVSPKSRSWQGEERLNVWCL